VLPTHAVGARLIHRFTPCTACPNMMLAATQCTHSLPADGWLGTTSYLKLLNSRRHYFTRNVLHANGEQHCSSNMPLRRMHHQPPGRCKALRETHSSCPCWWGSNTAQAAYHSRVCTTSHLVNARTGGGTHPRYVPRLPQVLRPSRMQTRHCPANETCTDTWAAVCSQDRTQQVDSNLRCTQLLW
jgi:hypothetical protein